MARLARTSAAAALALFALFAAPASAQKVPVGFRDLVFLNPTGVGSLFLTSQVFYPATQDGADAPILTVPGGHPVIVFLHGLGLLGSFYPDIGRTFAEAGYVTVMSNTAVFDADLQRDDGIALFHALVAADQTPGNFLAGALDMEHAGIAGHSMGGGGTVRVLAQNPGYLAGFGFAPWAGPSTLPESWAESDAAQVAAPLALVHGMGDLIVAFQDSFDFYELASGFTGVKVLNLLDVSCSHTNIAIQLPISSENDKQVFAISTGMAIGWFDHYLRGEPAGLEPLAGPTILTNPRLAQHRVEVASPELWNVGALAVGGSALVHGLSEPGLAAIFAAPQAASLPTPFGTLLLDPATLFPIAQGGVGADGLTSFAAKLPPNPALAGVTVFAQAIGLTNAGALRVSGSLALTVQS